MKKFRIVALLLVMCLASSCFVGGTFAKYSSTATGDDSAVVAAWSFSFGTDDITEVNDVASFDLFNTIKSTNGSNEENTRTGYIAPGTQGSFVIGISNDSDVTADYTVSFTDSATPDIAIEFSPNGTSGWTSDISTFNVTDGQIGWGEADESIEIFWRWVYHVDDAGDIADTADGVDAQTEVSYTVNVSFSATQVD